MSNHTVRCSNCGRPMKKVGKRTYKCPECDKEGYQFPQADGEDP